MHKTSLERELDFDKRILAVAREIAEDVEKNAKLNFVQEPFVFSYNNNREKREDEIFTPPMSHIPKPNLQQIKEGMYISFPGVNAILTLLDCRSVIILW